MDTAKTTFGYSPDKLIRLLRVGEETAEARVGQSDARRRSVLDAWLEREDPALAGRGGPGESWADAVRPLQELLLSANTGPQTLMAVKAVCKSRVARPEDAVEKDVATVVYYAAIAAGLVFHQQMMTSHSLESLREAFVRLGREPWVRPELTKLFSEAVAVLEQQAAGNVDS